MTAPTVASTPAGPLNVLNAAAAASRLLAVVDHLRWIATTPFGHAAGDRGELMLVARDIQVTLGASPQLRRLVPDLAADVERDPLGTLERHRSELEEVSSSFFG